MWVIKIVIRVSGTAAGQDLSIPHGAPVRLRVETQMGYKSMKYLQRIVVTNEFDDGGKKGNIQNGWSWYVGI